MPIYTGPTSSGEYVGDSPGRQLNGDLYAQVGDGPVVGVVDERGVRIHLAGMDGWWDAAETTGQIAQRIGDHGGWPSDAYWAPRVVQITARLFGSSWDHISESLSALVASVPVQELVPLVVTDHGAPLEVSVRQEGRPLVARRGAFAEVSLSLVAPDPRRYSPYTQVVETGLPTTSGGLGLPLALPLSVSATTTSGVLYVENAGDVNTPATLTVYGPVDPFTISHTGPDGVSSTLRHHEAVPAGRRLVIDTDRREALLDGTARRRVTGSWFHYPPGVSTVSFQAATYNTTARLVSEHRSAWR